MSTDLPVNPDEPMATQSKRAAMVADDIPELGIVYRMPVDMTNPDHLDMIRGELGEDVELPDDPDGVYYLLYVSMDDGQRVAVLLGEGEPRAFLLGFALARGGMKLAKRFIYRTTLFPQ